MGRLIAFSLALLVTTTARADAQLELAVRALREDPSLKVRTQAAIVLGQRGAPEAIPALREAATRDDAPAVRVAAVSALARIGDRAGRPAIEAARHDPDAKVRAAAERALVAFRAPARAPAGALAFSIEEPSGDAGGPEARRALRDAIVRQLEARGHAIVPGGAAYVLKPSVMTVDVSSSGGQTVIAVRASLVAVDGAGRMAAMLEGGAKLRAAGELARSAVPRYAARALDAAAGTLCDDLTARLR